MTCHYNYSLDTWNKKLPWFSHPNRFSPPLILCNTIQGFKWDNWNIASFDNLKIRYLGSSAETKMSKRKIIIRYFVTNGCTARGRMIGRRVPLACSQTAFNANLMSSKEKNYHILNFAVCRDVASSPPVSKYPFQSRKSIFRYSLRVQ